MSNHRPWAPFNPPAADPNLLQVPHAITNKDDANNRHHNAARIESTVSIGTSKQIQQHLDSGNAIYLGVGPRDLNRVFRDSAHTPESLVQDFNRHSGRAARNKAFAKLMCGLSLDFMAKFVLVVGLYLGGHTFMTGLSTFVARKSDREEFTFVIAVIQLIWGFYLCTVCMFGISLMWGKLRRSSTATLVFTIVWTFTTFVILVTAAIWLYFFNASRARRIQRCNSRTVRAGPEKGFDAPRRIAPQDRIDECVDRAIAKGLGMLVNGIVHLFMAILGITVILWARDYRGRLQEVDEFRRLQENINEDDEEVGLVIGTVPIGGRKAWRPTWKESYYGSRNNSQAAASPSIYVDDDEPVFTGDRRRRTSISMGSGLLAVSARHSDLYPILTPPASAAMPERRPPGDAVIARVL